MSVTKGRKLVHISVQELDLITTVKSSKEYSNEHFKKFPEFYKENIMAGAKRANNIYSRRDILLAALLKRKSTIVVPHKVVVAPAVVNGKAPSLPDHAEILVKILNELRIHTKQYDELLQIAKAPKQPFGIPHK
jgi:hypothetical protein